MDLELDYYKRWAEVRRKMGLFGMILAHACLVWPLLLAFLEWMQGGAPGDYLSAIAVFCWALFGFSQFWVWGRETKGLVAEIEKLRAAGPDGRTLFGAER